MRGSIARKGKRWYAVVDVGRDENGRRKQRWHSGYRTRRDAQPALTEILASLQPGAYVQPTKQALGPFLREWLDARRAQLRPSTLHGYQKLIRLHIGPHLGSVPLQQLTPQRLGGFYSALLRDGRRHKNGGLSPRTVGHVHRLLHRALRDAVRWRIIPNNPADQVDRPARSPKRCAHGRPRRCAAS